MAQTERFVSDGKTIAVAVLSATVIEKGDFIALSALNETAIPVSDIADAGDAAANREAAADVFIGIARTASAAGETEKVVVGISLEDVYELDLQTAGALSFGDQVEVYADTNGCYDQVVVAGSTSPIAVCVEDKVAAGTSFKAVLTPQLLMRPIQT
jgi:hypothetical protein